jgi:predicted nucleic acid-binding protein
VTTPVVADAGPLIGLARVGRLDLLRALYGTVFIPPAVLDEFMLAESRPGATPLSLALQEERLSVRPPAPSPDLARLQLLLDPGESEAILLGAQCGCRFLLIDDRRGRRVARRWGLPVVGTGGVLLAAKAAGYLEAIALVLEDLRRARYRLSADLVDGLLRRAGEGGE